MKLYKLIFPYRKAIREVITYDNQLFNREKALLELQGYKLVHQYTEMYGNDEHYIYIYVQL